MNLHPGDLLLVKKLNSKAKVPVMQAYAKVHSIYKDYMVVNYDNYTGTIDFFDVKSGKIQLTRIKYEEGKTMEQKITKEQLLEECKLHGTGKDAIRKIAEKYGASFGTIQNYIWSLGVKKELQRQEETKKAGLEQFSELDYAFSNQKESNPTALIFKTFNELMPPTFKKLIPTGFTSKETLLNYDINSSNGKLLVFNVSGNTIDIRFDLIDTFIDELREVQAALKDIAV
jgi:hypothetical protein